MEIYKIKNNINNKSYIGQTQYSIYDRYYCPKKWWKYIDNRFLKQDIKDYGHEYFTISILENNISNLTILNDLEKKYIKLHNTIYPHGYNLLKGGFNKKHHDTTKEKLSYIISKGKKYKFRSPNGDIIEVKNLTKFCKENNLDLCKMCFVFNGKRKQHKHWTRYDVILKEWKFLSPLNEIFIIKEKDLALFCRKNNLHRQHMWAVGEGKMKSYKKWRKI